MRNTPITRLVVGTLLVLGVALATATKPDETEVWAAAVWCALWAGLEVYWAARENKRRGLAHWSVAPAVLTAIIACNELRPRQSEVSATYTGTMRSLSIAVEVNRWP